MLSITQIYFKYILQLKYKQLNHFFREKKSKQKKMKQSRDNNGYVDDEHGQNTSNGQTVDVQMNRLPIV